MCLFLLVAPIALLTVLWTKHSPSTWLLAVTAFSVEVIVKVRELYVSRTLSLHRMSDTIFHITMTLQILLFVFFLSCLLLSCGDNFQFNRMHTNV